MKRKILLMLAMAFVLVCVLAISVSATVTTYDDAPARAKIQIKTDDIIEFSDGFKTLSAYVFKDVTEIGRSYNNTETFSSHMDFSYINEKTGKEYTFADVVGFDIPEGITTIKIYAGINLKTIKWISIPATAVNLDNAIFQGASGLEECTFEHGEDSALKVFPAYTFYGCTNLRAFSMPDSITKLPDCAHFSKCTNLTAVHLSKNLTTWETGGGGSRNATFDDCVNMYFVNEPFTYDNIPQKPTVYYFPANLTSTEASKDFSKNSTMRECKNLNDVLVFGTKVTAIPNEYLFQSGPKNTIVFLGDMTTVSTKYWGSTQTIFFANPNDKATTDIASYTNTRAAVFCYAEGNTTHLAELTGRTSTPDCVNPGMTYDVCYCGQAFNKTADPSAPALGHIYEENKIVAISYADVAKNGTYTTICDRCDHNEVAVKADSALFVYNGISTNGTGEMCVGYVINTEAINLYKQFNQDATLSFGIVAAATDYIGDNATPLDTNGDVVASNVIKTEIAETSIRAVDFKLKGDFSLAENAKLNLTMGMYVILNGNVSYIYNSATDGKNEASCNADVKVVTYEEVSSVAKQ